MKPNFALTLSFEGIGLLHRSPAGWARVGEVPLDVPDLPGALALLKKTAAQITPEALSVKIALPPEQIKYLRLERQDGGAQAQERAVQAALDGATPYALEELAYCWAEADQALVVAAVARETLREAEDFARDNGFQPLYFTARPEAGEYTGEPFFGPCSGLDAAPEPDTEVGAIIGSAVIPAAPQPELELEPEAAEGPEAAVPTFSSRRDGAGLSSSTPALTGVTRTPPNVIAPSIPLGAGDAGSPALSTPDGTPDALTVPAAPPEAAPAAQAQGEPAAKTTGTRPLQSTGFAPVGTGKSVPKQTATGKPRFLGLILTAVLLVFLLGVAAWASIFVGEGLARLFGSAPERSVLAPSDPDETEIEGDEAMVLEPPLNLRAPETGEAPSSAGVGPVVPRTGPQITLKDAVENYAVTGVWVLAPEAPIAPPRQDLDDLYVASIDPAIEAQDAIALPALAPVEEDGLLGRQANPAARGQSFELDDRGLVKATPEGALSPEGHRVFAGKPPYFPRELPERAERVEAVGGGLAELRPRARPSGLAEAHERATLGGRSRSELAAIRPKLRPALARDTAAASPQTTPESALGAAIEEAVAQAVPPTPGAVVIRVPQTPAPDLDPNATPQAVARSIKPKDRPKNFESIIERAERNQENTEQEEGVTQVAALAPRTVSPSIPSRSSVAKQATLRNAINLKRVNLIGVYGKPSSRSALVRLSNGRYQKVKVGDRIDGGRVSAIGETELIYQKNGRGVTLKMPKG